jgi:hypothetical protein
MKNFNKLFFLVVSLIITTNIIAQSIQMPKWPLNGYEIDFTQTPVVSVPMNSYLSGAKGATNGYYRENATHDLLFNIIDNKLFDPDGNWVADLYTDNDNTADEMGPEIIVVPADPTNNCLYYIIYTIQQNNDDNTHLWKVCYNLVCWYGPSVVESGVLASQSGITLGGIAISDFISDNGNVYHKLHLVGDNSINVPSQNMYINGELRLKVLTTITNEWLYDFCELEMSKDGHVLAAAHINIDKSNMNYSTPYNFTIWCIDDNDMPIATYRKDIGETGSASRDEQFTGVEIYQDPINPYIKKIHWSKVGGSNYASLIIGTAYYGTNELLGTGGPYSYSQIELDRRGLMIATNAGGYLQEINPNDQVMTQREIGLHNPVRNDFIYNSSPGSTQTAPTVYTLPDQVDQADYSSYTIGTEFDCCEASHVSIMKTTMAGVEMASNGDITITGTVTWNTISNPFTYDGNAITDIYLKGDITINTGAKLTINGLTVHFKEAETLDMSYNAGGVGSRLVLTNAKLTVFDDCDANAMWGGVSCSGYWGAPQGSTLTSHQPYTYMSSSTIEFAEKGIEANCGGIVKAYNSDFKDNLMDVSFTSYSYEGVDNSSFFSTCEFYTTANLYNKGRNPLTHVNAWTAPGLAFYGCDFKNYYASYVSTSQRGGGILSTYSSITVKEKCSGFQLFGQPCPDLYTTRGSFTDLYYAIKANSGSFMTLSRQNFTNCAKGSWLIDCDAIKVTECNFDVSSETLSSSYLYDSYGLYVESSTGYQIEGNEFFDGVLGMVVYNSGIDENLIYKNTFYNLSGNNNATGLVAIGENGTLSSKLFPFISGLQMRCNTFNEVDYSMAVLGGTIQTTDPVTPYPTITSSNIRKIQGTDDQGALISTYNEFISINSTPYEYHYLYFDPNVSTMPGLYVYNQTASNGFYIPSNCVQTSLFTTSDYVSQTCPQTIYTGGGIIIFPLMETIGGLNDEETELESELAGLTSYDELNLEISAQTANVSNTTDVYNALYEESPYLTSEILLAYLNNTNVNELSRASLMLANSPLPTDVIEAVDNSDLSNSYKAYILKYQNGENPLEQKRNHINSLRSARQFNYDKLIRVVFESDTTPNFAETYSTVLSFMETQSDLHAQKKLADMYSHKDMFAKADNVLNELESIALSNEDVSLYNHVQLRRMRNDIKQTHSVEDANAVVIENEEYLRELASDYNTKEGGAARAMLASADLWNNFPIVFLPNPEITMEDKSARINNDENLGELIPELESLFSIYPNPANDYLSVEFINPDGNCTFSIYTIKGDLVKTVSTNQQLGFMSINISDLESGNYIINCPELNSSQNFMIVR